MLRRVLRLGDKLRPADKRLYRGNAPRREAYDAEPVWLNESQWNRLFCFVHVPKTAGTSFKNLLFEVYGRGFFANRRLARSTPELVTPDEARNILAIGGHLPHGFHRRFGQRHTKAKDGVFAGREIFYVTVVRNPVDRLLSLSRFIRTFPAHPLHRETKHMTCAQFFDYLVDAHHPTILGDLQCALLTDGQPERAIEYADTRYSAIATISGISAMVEALGRRLDWPEVSIGHKNASPKKLSDESDRQRAEALCNEFCREDMALYEHVRSKPSEFLVQD